MSVQILKQRYNKTLALFNQAAAYMDNNSIPVAEREKRIPAFRALLRKLDAVADELRQQGIILTDYGRLHGFQNQGQADVILEYPAGFNQADIIEDLKEKNLKCSYIAVLQQSRKLRLYCARVQSSTSDLKNPMDEEQAYLQLERADIQGECNGMTLDCQSGCHT